MATSVNKSVGNLAQMLDEVHEVVNIHNIGSAICILEDADLKRAYIWLGYDHLVRAHVLKKSDLIAHLKEAIAALERFKEDSIEV